MRKTLHAERRLPPSQLFRSSRSYGLSTVCCTRRVARFENSSMPGHHDSTRSVELHPIRAGTVCQEAIFGVPVVVHRVLHAIGELARDIRQKFVRILVFTGVERM